VELTTVPRHPVRRRPFHGEGMRVESKWKGLDPHNGLDISTPMQPRHSTSGLLQRSSHGVVNTQVDTVLGYYCNSRLNQFR